MDHLRGVHLHVSPIFMGGLDDLHLIQVQTWSIQVQTWSFAVEKTPAFDLDLGYAAMMDMPWASRFNRSPLELIWPTS